MVVWIGIVWISMQMIKSLDYQVNNLNQVMFLMGIFVLHRN